MDECGIYGVIQAEDTLSGKLDRGGEIRGRLDTEGVLVGEVGFPQCVYPNTYKGAYEVTPHSYEQTLETAHYYMQRDVTVHSIPYWETSNLSDGLTAYIGN